MEFLPFLLDTFGIECLVVEGEYFIEILVVHLEGEKAHGEEFMIL